MDPRVHTRDDPLARTSTSSHAVWSSENGLYLAYRGPETGEQVGQNAEN